MRSKHTPVQIDNVTGAHQFYDAAAMLQARIRAGGENSAKFKYGVRAGRRAYQMLENIAGVKVVEDLRLGDHTATVHAYKE